MADYPYRGPGEDPLCDAPRAGAANDVVPVLVLFWLVSVVIAVAPLLRHATYGGEATLACLVVFGLPFLIRDELRASSRRARRAAAVTDAG